MPYKSKLELTYLLMVAKGGLLSLNNSRHNTFQVQLVPNSHKSFF